METISQQYVDGIVYTLHIDNQDPPCGTRKYNEGCYVEWANGEKAVYVASIAPQWVVDHELAHVKGMRHTQWRETDRGVCAFVIQSGGKYARGDTLCNTATGEHVIRLGDS